MCIFVLFKNNFCRKIVDFSGIETLIVGVEGERTDHLTTTTAQKTCNFPYSDYFRPSITSEFTIQISMEGSRLTSSFSILTYLTNCPKASFYVLNRNLS